MYIILIISPLKQGDWCPVGEMQLDEACCWQPQPVSYIDWLSNFCRLRDSTWKSPIHPHIVLLGNGQQVLCPSAVSRRQWWCQEWEHLSFVPVPATLGRCWVGKMIWVIRINRAQKKQLCLSYFLLSCLHNILGFRRKNGVCVYVCVYEPLCIRVWKSLFLIFFMTACKDGRVNCLKSLL